MPLSQINTNAIANNITLLGTGGVGIPSGNTAQRLITTTPNIRFNTDTNSYEGYSPVANTYTTVGGGAKGGGSDSIFFENGQTVTTNYTLSANTNAMSAGPITINSGVSVTVGNNQSWTII
jgi:hypothetical protein